MGPDEEIKPRLSQALTRDARSDSNSKPAMQISNSLPSYYIPWGLKQYETLSSLPLPLTVWFSGSMVFLGSLCIKYFT